MYTQRCIVEQSERSKNPEDTSKSGTAPRTRLHTHRNISYIKHNMC